MPDSPSNITVSHRLPEPGLQDTKWRYSQPLTGDTMTHADTTDLTTVQALLDADRKHLIDRLLNDIKRQGWTEHTASGNEEHSILLALIGQLTQEVEDLRNQLELVQVRHNTAPDHPATPAGRDQAVQRPGSSGR